MTDLTGVWKTLVTDPSTPDKYEYVGELNITQMGNLVLSLSAPSWDRWQGYLASDSTGVEMLTACAYKDGLPRIIQARVSQDGDTLYGVWSITPADGPLWPKGGYLAKRKAPTEKTSPS